MSLESNSITMPTCVYIVKQTDDDYYDVPVTIGVFFDKEKAEKYAEIQEQLNEFYKCYVDEQKITEFDENTKVVPYYSYYIGKEVNSIEDIINYCFWNVREYLIENTIISKEKFLEFNSIEEEKEYIKGLDKQILEEMYAKLNHPDIIEDNTDETVNRIYDQDLVVKEDDEYIEVFSVKSYDEAREVALNIYQKSLPNKT